MRGLENDAEELAALMAEPAERYFVFLEDSCPGAS